MGNLQVPKSDGHGGGVKDKVGKIVMRKMGVNVLLKPATETGEGSTRRYARPVKVVALPSGEIQITVYDGDQFLVGTDGKSRHKPNLANPRITSSMGTAPTLQPAPSYKNAAGDEHTFYGRGYVQLTWGNN